MGTAQLGGNTAVETKTVRDNGRSYLLYPGYKNNYADIH